MKKVGISKNGFRIFVGMMVLGLAFYSQETASAKGVELYGDGNRARLGSNYWYTSNLREWANSEEQVVPYTNASPSSERTKFPYAHESGFLSGFSKEELNAVAVTEHRTYLSSHDANSVRDGGNSQIDANEYMGESLTFNLMSIDHYDTRFYQKVNDKVFLFQSYQLKQFVEKRGFSLLKSVTPEAKKKNNITSDVYSWWTNGPSSNIGNDNIQQVTSSRFDIISTTIPSSTSGFVPAIHVKPDTLIEGKRIDSYKIGETVRFGSYLSSPIEWRVVNRTKSGFPLLLSEKILDIKPFDVSGDAYSESLPTSDKLSFPNADVSMSESETYVPFDGKTDITPPSMKVMNEDALKTRSNSSFSVVLRAWDDESDIESITMPNGVVTTEKEFSYVLTENKDVAFKVKDKSGNVKVFTVPVSNINPPSKVLIESSSNGWTNKDVTVDISASNDVGFSGKSWTQSNRDAVPYIFPDYTGYLGKRIKISGKMEFVDSKNNSLNRQTGIGFHYHRTFKSGDDYYAGFNWIRTQTLSLQQLKDNGPVTFEHVFTVPGEYFRNLQAWSQIEMNAGLTDYTVRFSDISYELLDKDDFKIEKIILPNGKEVFSDSYRDTLTKEGAYEYNVVDSRGYENKRTINVQIDKGNPLITSKLSETKLTKEDVVIDVQASDILSGVKNITLPNGQVVSANQYQYRVVSNGIYSFKATDLAGNVSTLNVTVSNIDKDYPSFSSIEKNTPLFTQNASYQITIKGVQDSGSGIDRVYSETNVDGTKKIKELVYVSSGMYQVEWGKKDFADKEGLYQTNVYLMDKAGNKRTVTTESLKTYLDQTPPSVTATYSDTTNILSIDATDSGSMIKDLSLPTVNLVKSINQESFSYSFSPAFRGKYEVVLTNSVGLATRRIVSVGQGTAKAQFQNDGWNAKSTAPIVFEVMGEDNTPSSALLPNGQKVNGTLHQYLVSQNGVYTFTPYYGRWAGSPIEVTVSNFDRTKPSIEIKQQSNHVTIRIQDVGDVKE